ncbi:unnamed protein product [Adineta steineri]|uniref:Uncharacterized protein n=1 Tax=Adineta steineri TaxID=433720 RepID=A0A813RBJ1_9BILA|nr:unnamed protein product [Adineta steineri]CAF0828451.1 unnamed protein product [Adineta steineri]
MIKNKCKSLENLVPIATAKFSQTQFPQHFETYRNELHHEMAMHWPFRTNVSDSKNIVPTVSKSTAHSSIRDGNKSNFISTEKDTVYRTISSNLTGKNVKPVEINKTISEFSLDENEQRTEWNFKAQEGIITYQLPDNLPDGLALHNKLQKLMKTNTIYLNDRRFWTTLENRFKILRKQNFQQNMQRLRQSQQQYEQELISKGLIPYTTEEAIKNYVEQQRLQIITNNIDIDNSYRKKCLIDYIPSNKPLNKNEEFEAFESDNVHPRLENILPDYKFQTKLGKDLGMKFENDLHKSQIQIKTIFPKINQSDRIRQELEAVKTSEGLYAYSNRLIKQISK